MFRHCKVWLRSLGHAQVFELVDSVFRKTAPGRLDQLHSENRETTISAFAFFHDVSEIGWQSLRAGARIRARVARTAKPSIFMGCREQTLEIFNIVREHSSNLSNCFHLKGLWHHLIPLLIFSWLLQGFLPIPKPSFVKVVLDSAVLSGNRSSI
jgi:hypothetical protein